VRPDALELAKLLVPEELYLQFLERSILTGFDHGAKDGLAELEGEHPGLAEAIRAELVKVARDYFRSEMPATSDRYARAIAQHFEPSDVAQLVTFYETRTGQKIIVGKFAGADLSGLLKKVDVDPDAAVTQGDIRSINKSAVSKLIPHLDANDRAALLAFMSTKAFTKLTQFTGTMVALEAQIAGEPDPELDRRIEAAVATVMARFIPSSETS
jgi:hypothetical protein